MYPPVAYTSLPVAADSDTMTGVTDRETLLAAILDDPSDDTTRLVLADMLRESDDPDAVARGRFLWAGVTASQFCGHDVIDDPA